MMLPATALSPAVLFKSSSPALIVVSPLYVFADVPLNTSVPVPALVRSWAPLMMPLTVIELTELLVQLWLAPRPTAALMAPPAAPEFMVRPPVPRVRLKAPPGEMVIAFVSVGDVPRMVRLLIEKSAPSVVLNVLAFVVV